MKESIKNVFGVTALLLAFLAAPLANAQNPPLPATQSPANNRIQLPTLPAGMDPTNPLAQVIRLVQAGAAGNVVLAFITNSSRPFDLSKANVAYLNDLGTPFDIQAAMTQRNQELGSVAGTQSPQAASSDQAQEPQDITEDYFYGALAPYGTWINIPGYGFCWQPCTEAYDANWAPYCTLGQWIYTDCGWYWLSGYSWGWCVFHYGRWFHDAQHGWCWWPSTTWGPSWVFWRYSGSYCGWAPLPPHAYYSQENGLIYNRASIASGYDFGMGANLFNFVPMAHFCDANLERVRLPAAQAGQVFAQSEVLNAINSNDRIIVNDGIPVSRIAAYNGGNMSSFTIQPAETVAIPGVRGEQILSDGETLAINRPYFNANVPSALKQGVWPIVARQQPVAHRSPTYIVNQIPYSYPSDADDENNNSVIYVDSAAQNGPPIPTVTTEGPQDRNAPGPAPIVSGGSYWSVTAEAPVQVDTASAFMSPRQRSHERSGHRVDQPSGHREFNPPANGSHPEQHQDNHPPGHEQRGNDVHPASQDSNRTSSPSHSSTPGGPAHPDSGSSGHGDNHGH